MNKVVFILATLILSPPSVMASHGQQQAPAASAQSAEVSRARPVKRRLTPPAEAEAAAREFNFLGFDFKEIYYGYEGPGYAKVAGEPAKGTESVAEARLFMAPAIATVKFELLDQSGRAIQTLYLVKEDTDVSSGEFVGVVPVPAQPFRVAVTGVSLTGKSYRRVYGRLFRPTDEPPAAPRVPPGLPPERAKLYRQALAEHDRLAKARLTQQGRENTGGVISLPRVEVFEATYEPLLSVQGNTIGIRLRYAVRVSRDGYYRLHPSAWSDYTAGELRGKIRMEAIAGTVTPSPSETGTDDPSDLLRFGGGGKFKAGEVYRFTADMAPDFALRNAAGTRFCIERTTFKQSRSAEAAWRAVVESDVPVTYGVDVAGTNFTGRIENFYAPSVFHRSFLKEGAGECGEHGNIDF